MDFKNERLMLSEEETRKRAKELINENQANLITKYMFLEQQVKKQKEVIDKIFSRITLLKMEDITIKTSKVLDELLDILKEVSE